VGGNFQRAISPRSYWCITTELKDTGAIMMVQCADDSHSVRHQSMCSISSSIHTYLLLILMWNIFVIRYVQYSTLVYTRQGCSTYSVFVTHKFRETKKKRIGLHACYLCSRGKKTNNGKLFQASSSC